MQFVANNWHLFVALAIVLFLLFRAPLLGLVHGIRGIGTAQAIRLANREAGVLLDVREAAELTGGRIPEALHIPLSQLPKRVADLEKYKSRPLVVYCRSGQRSLQGALILRRKGFANVHHLSGGFSAWQGDNLPVSK